MPSQDLLYWHNKNQNNTDHRFRILFDNRSHFVLPHISVIIPVHGNFDGLEKLFQALKKEESKDLQLEVIIVDDQSKENIQSFIFKHKAYSSWMCIRTDKNVGYSIACNIAAKEARANDFLVVNTDVEPIKEGWLSALKESKESHNTECISPVLLYPDKSTVQYAGAILTSGDYDYPSFDHKHCFKGQPLAAVPTEPFYSESLSGACFLINRKTPLFDPAYSLGYGFEDADLAMELKNKDSYNLVDPTVVLIHHESQSFGKEIHASPRKDLNRLLFWDKWHRYVDAYEINKPIRKKNKKRKPRILYVSHGLPPENVAGVEVYTLQLAKAMSQMNDVFCLYPSFSAEGYTGQINYERQEENASIFKILNKIDNYDFFSNTGGNPDVFEPHFQKFLKEIEPDIVHFQHTNFTSVNMVGWAKKLTKVAYTLNEYLPICANHGQLTTTSNQLCEGYSTTKCMACVNVSEKRIIARHNLYFDNLRQADILIAPSKFLKEKFKTWGLSNVHVLNYGFKDYRVPKNDGYRLVNKETLTFGFLGNITPFKGLDILLKAFDEPIENAKLDIHGICGPASIKETLNRFCEKEWISYQGPYAPDAVPEILKTIDILVVPSIWWENSPLVMHEAAKMGVPIIATNIGGMKEFIEKHGGIGFERDNYKDLRRIIENLTTDRVLLKKIIPDSSLIRDIDKHARDMMELYQCELFT